MSRRSKRKLKKLLKDVIGGSFFMIALLTIGCLDSAENILPLIIVLLISMLVLNRMYGE